jgi:hypothetical protein
MSTPKKLSWTDMVAALKDVPKGSTIFVSYIPGRPAAAQALREGERATAEGVSPRHFTGRLDRVWQTKRYREWCFTLWVEERDSTHRNGTMTRGAFRAFNPSLGRLLTLEVIQRA